jgi:hypothetical protein
MERWELEGKRMYRNPQNTDNRGFRRPSNNVPKALPREQRRKKEMIIGFNPPSKIT